MTATRLFRLKLTIVILSAENAFGLGYLLLVKICSNHLPRYLAN
jgi:hypothetical protein